VRTGQDRGSEALVPQVPAGFSFSSPDLGVEASDVRSELAAMEQRLRQEFGAGRTLSTPAEAVNASVAPRTSEEAFLRKVQQMIDESEIRQQRNLALRMADVSRDFSLQRRQDLVQIEQGLGRLEGRTEAEAARQREIMNYIIRVSQPPR
jgi:hypothetical protein